MLRWAAGRGEGGGLRALRVSRSLSLRMSSQIRSTCALWERSGFCLGWLPSPELATMLSCLLSPPSIGFTIVNWFQIVLLYWEFLLMEVLSGMQIVMIINEGNL